MTIVISIENVWKEYRLGVIGHGTLAQDLQSWWAKIRGAEDPNSKLSLVQKGLERQIDGDHFWALQDINLEVEEGEILGIIGKNGAGKSTLLKILSRVTKPTKGRIKIKGRIASLLEVGTGFHPELTGRENVYLNGAILGMSKQEVSTKFDEIIDFSGIESFIDTPVKRYSSGMYVRLAFAVAAHLEPEILIIDEVLAVGDADFQKKCLGKMGEVAHAGRTVLFVSHNMGAVNQLCTKGALFADGVVKDYGHTENIIEKYLCGESEKISKKVWNDDTALGNEAVKLISVEINNSMDRANALWTDESFNIEVVIRVMKPNVTVGIGLIIRNSFGHSIVHSSSLVSTTAEMGKGDWFFKAEIPSNLLNIGEYFVTVSCDEPNKEVMFVADNILRFSIASKSNNTSMYSRNAWTGVLCPEIINWTKNQHR